MEKGWRQGVVIIAISDKYGKVKVEDNGRIF